MGKSVIKTLWGSSQRSQHWLNISQRCTQHTCFNNQVSKRQTSANKQRKYPQRDDIDVLFMSEKKSKMIHLKLLKPGDNPHACGAALGELGMRKPLYVPLRSTWLNRWYICMLICLISLLQMSYRHIKGLTLRHNDIRASDGGLMKTWGSHSFKSSIETFKPAVK